jgi:hypothetical protein
MLNKTVSGVRSFTINIAFTLSSAEAVKSRRKTALNEE